MNSGHKFNYEFYLKIAFAIAGSAALVYFGGPLAAIAGRAIYTLTYAIMFGIPAIYQPSYWLVFMPGREHFSGLAYYWGPTLLGTAAAPMFYFTVDAAKYVGNTAYHAATYLYSLTQLTPSLIHVVPEEKIEQLEDELFSFVIIESPVQSSLKTQHPKNSHTPYYDEITKAISSNPSGEIELMKKRLDPPRKRHETKKN